MSVVQRHTTIYSVMIKQTPQYIVCSNNRQRTGDSGRATVDGGQLQAGAEGAQMGRSFRPWPCRGRAEKSPWTAQRPSQGHRGGGGSPRGIWRRLRPWRRGGLIVPNPRPVFHIIRPDDQSVNEGVNVSVTGAGLQSGEGFTR
jgi:hypothetical protein